MKSIFQWLFRHRIAALGAAFVLAIALMVLWSLLVPASSGRIEAIRAKGYPTTVTELNAWYASTPAASNAARIYTQAFEMPMPEIDTLGDMLAPQNLSTRGQPLPAESRRELSEVVSNSAEALKLLHSPGLTDACRYPIDLRQGPMTLLPHLAKMKRCGQLLMVEAVLAADREDPAGATRALLAAGRLADSVQNEPLLISQLVRIALWAIIMPRLEWVVNRAELTPAQVLELQQMLARAENCPGLLRALVGEQTCGLGIFTDSQYQASLFGGANWGAAPTQGQRMRSVTLVSVLKTTGIFQKDRTVFLDVMAATVAAAELPYPERLVAGRKAATLATTLPTRFCIFSRMLLPALGKTFDKDAEHAARLRTAETALAIESFRKAHSNKLPENLQELVPAHLASVPLDPYDGKPLRYKRLNAGYVVYSIGPDEKDDGGLEAAAKKGLARDVTFILSR